MRHFQEHALGENQPRRDGDSPGLIELVMQGVETQARKLSESLPALDSASPWPASANIGDPSDLVNAFVVVAILSPHQRHVNAQQYMSWMNPDHPAHRCFESLHPPSAGDSVRLDWEGSEDAPLQRLMRNANGPNFYQEMILLYQEKWRNKDPSPWPGGQICPPCCFEFSIHMAPSGHIILEGR